MLLKKISPYLLKKLMVPRVKLKKAGKETFFKTAEVLLRVPQNTDSPWTTTVKVCRTDYKVLLSKPFFTKWPKVFPFHRLRLFTHAT